MKILIIRASEIVLPLAIVFLLSSCANRGMAPEDVQQQAFDDFRTEIHEVIGDPERAEKAIELTQQLADDVLHFSEKYAKRRTEVRKLNFDYDTPRAEFEAFFCYSGCGDARKSKTCQENPSRIAVNNDRGRMAYALKGTDVRNFFCAQNYQRHLTGRQ